MRTRIAAAVLAVLAAGVLTAPSAPAAPAAATKVTASAPVPGTGELATTVVMPGGTAVVTYTSAGLTKFAVRPHSMSRLGTVKVPKDPHRYSFVRAVLAHPAGRFVYVVWTGRIQVFDVSARTPRLVRTVTADRVFPDMIRPGVLSATFDPEGRRLIVGGARNLRVIGTKHPARPTIGVQTDAPEVAFDLAVTPDGTSLVAGGSVDVVPTVFVYSLPSRGAPVLQRQGTVTVPGWHADWGGSVGTVVAAPDGATAYLDVGTAGEGSEQFDEALVRVRLDDLSTVALAAEQFRAPFLQDVTANGSRVYFTYGAISDEGEHTTRALSWADRDLGARHDAGPVGDVVGTAVSKAGPTRGLVYVVVLTRSGLRLRSVNVG